MRRAAALCGLILCALAMAGAAAHAATPRLTEAAGARFPDRAFALTLPKPGPVTVGQVSLTENGRAVRDVDVIPAERSGGRRFGVVLAIDTSYSMHGRPLAAAQEAARAFVRRRRPDQPVALIAFAGDVRVVLPFSTDRAAIERGLASVTASGGGSRIIDAASQAVAMIRAAGMSSGSAVVLSDGADRGSRTTIDAVSVAAKTTGARVFSVGLRSHSNDFGTLNLLAAGSSGEFSSAGSLNDLARVYDRLGSQLAHQYLLRYRSAASPGQRVDVRARIGGVPGAANATYAAPPVAVPVHPPFHHGQLADFWTTPSAMVLIAAIVAALVGLAAWIVLRPRRGTLRERMAAFVAPPPEEEPEARGGGLLSDRLLHGAERSLGRRAWWATFEERVDVARIDMPPVRLLGLVGMGTLLLLILLPVVGGSLAFALPALLLPVAAKAIVDRKVGQQHKLFGEQLPDNLQVIASAMRAGHSFAGALAVVVEDAPEPTRREMQRVIADERLGVPLDTALGVVVRRMASEDLEQVALVAALHRETGGNTAEVLDRVTESVRERMGLQRMVTTLTAQGRMSRWVLTALPCVLLAVISALNPDYVAPLFETTIGRLLLGLAAAMVCAGSVVIKRIVDIKV